MAERLRGALSARERENKFKDASGYTIWFLLRLPNQASFLTRVFSGGPGLAPSLPLRQLKARRAVIGPVQASSLMNSVKDGDRCGPFVRRDPQNEGTRYVQVAWS